MASRSRVTRGKTVSSSAEMAKDISWSFSYILFAKMLSLNTLVCTPLEQTLIDFGLRDDYYYLMDSMGLGNLTNKASSKHQAGKLVSRHNDSVF